MSMDDELFEAIERGELDRLRGLLSAGADPNVIGAEPWPDWRPLHAAIEAMEDGGLLASVSILLEHGADADGWDAQRDATPLLMAVFRNQPEVVRLLLDAGADVNVVGGEGDSPLRWAAQQGDIELARLLLDRGAARDLDVGGGVSGMNALGIAAHRLDVEMVQFLLDAGARPDALDADGWVASRRADRPDDAAELRRWHEVMALLSSSPKAP
jgi:ankyrin repeat protein